MNRRDFFKLGAGALLSTRPAAALPGRAGFEAKTKHLIAIILGSGARTMDVIGNRDHAPFQSAMVKSGTLFTEDYGDTVGLPGYMYNEILTGREATSQRPLFPTWNEYVRKKTGAKATDFWMLQGVSYYRGWTWDVKHFSNHPEYGPRYGATSLTMNKLFRPTRDLTPAQMVERFVERGLAHSAAERKQIEAWIADVLTSKRYELPSTRQPVIERELQIGDCQSLLLAADILKAFEPKMITIQLLGLGDAQTDFQLNSTNYGTYVKHIATTDELIGKLWHRIQSDSYLRRTTALVVRPDCGRDSAVNRFGQLGHSPGERPAHTVWTLALGPDFDEGLVVSQRVQRRDLAPTITYLMTGQTAEYATGTVRSQMVAGTGQPAVN